MVQARCGMQLWSLSLWLSCNLRLLFLHEFLKTRWQLFNGSPYPIHICNKCYPSFAHACRINYPLEIASLCWTHLSLPKIYIDSLYFLCLIAQMLWVLSSCIDFVCPIYHQGPTKGMNTSDFFVMLYGLQQIWYAYSVSNIYVTFAWGAHINVASREFLIEVLNAWPLES